MGVNWGGRGVSPTVCVLFDMMVSWYWLCWRQCGSTVVVGLQLEEESLLRAYLPDHWDDGLFCMTTADNERLDQEPTDCPRTSCIIYSLLLYLCFVCTQTLGLASATSAHTEQRNPLSCLIPVLLQRCRHGTVLKLLPFIKSKMCSKDDWISVVFCYYAKGVDFYNIC